MGPRYSGFQLDRPVLLIISKNERHLFSLKSKTIIFGILTPRLACLTVEVAVGNSKIQNFILHVYQAQLGLGTWPLEPSCQTRGLYVPRSTFEEQEAHSGS